VLYCNRRVTAPATDSKPLLTAAAVPDKSPKGWVINEFCGRNDLFEATGTPRSRRDAEAFLSLHAAPNTGPTADRGGG